MTVASPITKTSNVRHFSTYEPCIMSDSRISDRRVDNYLCLDTGLIFNASGARGSEKDFYAEEYDLHSESLDSEFKYFESDKAVGIYDEIADLISANATFDTTPSILDIGCGKGLLFRKLRAKYPGAVLHGVEPSKNALKFFQKVFPDVSLFEGTFEDSPFRNMTFDLIAANGVLEHVPDPVAFLTRVRSCVGDNGCVYIGVPNFNNNPADLFTYDHLSRFTPETARMVFALGGFRIAAAKVSEQRVPMWYILKPTKVKTLSEIGVDIQQSAQLIERAQREVRAFFDSYDAAAVQARAKNKKVAIYGSGAFGLIGTRYTGLQPALISRILDDNTSVWGSERLGILIDDPQKLPAMSDTSELVISANPCYLGLIEAKIKVLLQGSSIVAHIPQVTS